MNTEQVNTYSREQLLEELNIKPYVLRFWESEFEMIQPSFERNGESYYTQDNKNLISQIKKLLFEEKLSIVQAKQQLLRNKTPQSFNLVEPNQKTQELNTLIVKKNIKNAIASIQEFRSEYSL